MSIKNEYGRGILFYFIAILSFFGCEKIGKESPTGVENAVDNQQLTKTNILVSLSRTPDIIVNTTYDVLDFAGANQVNDLPGQDGIVSLREAIIAANNTAGLNIIGFNIPKEDTGFDGVIFTIQPVIDPLPGLGDEETTIDGATQTGFTGNTNTLGPEIVIDGSLITTQPGEGFHIGASNCNIYNLVICNFTSGGIGIYSMATGTHVAGCFIGTDHTGIIAKGNGCGVGIGGNNSIIGGPTLGDGNLISGNSLGVMIYASSNNIVQGNLIGTDITGTMALPNDTGIEILDATQNLVGGKMLWQGNVISGNIGHGINFRGIANNNTILGNIIGTNRKGTTMIGNRGFGIGLCAGTQNTIARNIISRNLLGGILVETAESNIELNTICHNRGDGIWMGGCPDNPSFRKNTISRNLFFSNFGLGINLGCGSGIVTLNDQGDKDSGPNDFMNFPVLESAKITIGKLIVKGYIDTPNPESVIIEFFANPLFIPGSDSSGYGEGAVYLGSERPNTHGKFSVTLPKVSTGTFITATATNAEGNTSEFAANIKVKHKKR